MPPPAPNKERLQRWRLILGHHAHESLAKMGGPDSCQLTPDQIAIDEALAAIYDESGGEKSDGGRSAGLGPSAPKLAKWLGDIRTYFKEDVVTVIQHDAIEKKGLTQLLFEPEMLKQVEPNPHLVGALMALKGRIPERAKETARMIVRAVVEKIKRTLEQKIHQAVKGALRRNEHSPLPRAASIDWKWTVQRNLKHFQPALGVLVPEKVYFFSRAQRSNNWTILVCMDQSGSMAESIVYGSVMGAILSSLPSLNTRVIAFDTEVVDLTEQCGADPVDMIFGVQLGGGTDINKAVAYGEKFITDPAQTIFFLLTDLFEGGNQAQLVRRLREMAESGVRVICLLALSDGGTPTFDGNLAKKVAGCGIPCFACTPNSLPELIEGVLRKQDLQALAARITSSAKPNPNKV